MTDATPDPQPTPITRRRVVAGMAWSVPVVAVAAAVPVHAASDTPDCCLLGFSSFTSADEDGFEVLAEVLNSCDLSKQGPIILTVTVCGLEDVAYGNSVGGWVAAGAPGSPAPFSEGCYVLTFTMAGILTGRQGTTPGSAGGYVYFTTSSDPQTTGTMTLGVTVEGCAATSNPYTIPTP